MKILIGGAWPYANGSLHIGHLASLLPGDVIARYYRAKGDSVYYVSGSDCYGTPVALRARQENTSPEAVSQHYHEEFCDCFRKLGFSFDRYGQTTAAEHHAFVRDFHTRMYQGPYIYEKEAPQAYCDTCGKTLTDRFVVGQCPTCGERARGDQCDACGTVLEPENLIKPLCVSCGQGVRFLKTPHLFLALTRMREALAAHLDAHPAWRKNAQAFTRRYLDEGLRDRAITRDLDWGIHVPKENYEGKRIYIWAENVLGYLSMAQHIAQERGEDFATLWGEDSRHYYVHGKDNIPFHSIILPALMRANGGAWKWPDHLIASEYLTLEGRKISTSQGWAIWVKDLAERYHPDAIRYFMLANGPEKRDTDFSWRVFVDSYNGELLGAYGNFINRTLAFIHRYRAGVVPPGTLSPEMKEKVGRLFTAVGERIEAGQLKDALDTAFEGVRYGNKFFDAEKPWETRRHDAAACDQTLYTCVQWAANLAVVLAPFLPFSSGTVMRWLSLDPAWSPKAVPAGLCIPQPDILFERLDKSVVAEELNRLPR